MRIKEVFNGPLLGREGVSVIVGGYRHAVFRRANFNLMIKVGFPSGISYEYVRELTIDFKSRLGGADRSVNLGFPLTFYALSLLGKGTNELVLIFNVKSSSRETVGIVKNVFDRVIWGGKIKPQVKLIRVYDHDVREKYRKEWDYKLRRYGASLKLFS